MKGKYANAAERRRVMVQLEERAATAERGRERAVAELAACREMADGEIGRLRERLAEATSQRDAGASPLVASMEARAEALRRQLRDTEAAQKEKEKMWGQFVDGFRQYLVRVNGLTRIEAHEIMLNCFPGKERATYVVPKGSGDHRVDLTVGAVRGYRHVGDILPEIFGQLTDNPE